MKRQSAEELFDSELAKGKTEPCKSGDLCLVGQVPHPSRQNGSEARPETAAEPLTLIPASRAEVKGHELRINSLIPANIPETTPKAADSHGRSATTDVPKPSILSIPPLESLIPANINNSPPRSGDPRYPADVGAPSRKPIGDDSANAVNKPGAGAPSGFSDTLKAAVERAKKGGRPLTITQIGDSQIAAGIETPAIAAELAADLGLRANQVNFSWVGEVNRTAPYAKDHPGTFMQNVQPNTDLVIVSFGLNESTTQEGAQYVSDYTTLIGQIRSRDHSGAIAMVGPTDGNYWATNKHLVGLDSVRQAQQSVAAQVPNSAYFGGAARLGTVASMRAGQLMVWDNLHLTAAGYQQLGGIVADDIVRRIRSGP